MDVKKLKLVSDRLIGKIKESKADCLLKFPVENYIKLIKQYPKVADYHFVSPDVKGFCGNLKQYTNEHILELFHKLVLVALIAESQKVLPNKKFNQDINLLFETNYDRIINSVELESPEGAYLYSNDKFCKDLALTYFRLIPMGAQKINLSGLSKQFLLKCGFKQFIQGLNFVGMEMGGFSPLFEMHTDSNDPHLLGEFNEEGWIRFYKRMPDIFKLYPDVKGVFGSSWFFDPALDHISPRLAYLRTTVTDNGGKLFYIGPDEQSANNATSKSKTRKKLYQEGKYKPADYLLVWPRECLIAWAERNV